jgi:orotate phosphoribosyltransferase
MVYGALWIYDYVAKDKGKLGWHAKLKSEQHSNFFFVSKILIAVANIRAIISSQMFIRLRVAGVKKPNYVVGVPNGAIELGQDIARMFGTKLGVMVKNVEGKLVFETRIAPHSTILLVEDVCTKGTGFIEAVKAILAIEPTAIILPYNPVILNRGGLKKISIPNVGEFEILPIVEQKADDWDPKDCPLCRDGSMAIKPKETEENWELLTSSQL